MDYKTRLVAHRGDHEFAPENSLAAIKYAILAGARYVEVDVQLSQDKVPFVVHDNNLLRVAGADTQVLQTAASRLDKITLKKSQEVLPRLSAVINLLNRFPEEITAFIEIKIDGIYEFGKDAVLAKVLSALNKANFKFVLISYSYDFISLVKQKGLACGWVHDEYSNSTLKQVTKLNPDYFFTDAKGFLANSVLPSPVKTVVYTLNDSAQVKRLLEYDIYLVETDYFFKIYTELLHE